jgi:hypothetical protein
VGQINVHHTGFCSSVPLFSNWCDFSLVAEVWRCGVRCCLTWVFVSVSGEGRGGKRRYGHGSMDARVIPSFSHHTSDHYLQCSDLIDRRQLHSHPRKGVVKSSAQLCRPSKILQQKLCSPSMESSNQSFKETAMSDFDRGS